MKNKILTCVLLVISISILAFSWEKHKPVIYMIGDSTMANKPLEDNPERGWGQLLPEFFNDSVTIENHAANGRSTRSFIYEGRWDSIMGKLQPGDFVIIQFGHNDGSIKKPERYATLVEYRYNLTKFVKETRGKGAKPVLCTPVQRRRFDDSGKFYDTHGKYPDVVRNIAKQMNVPLVEMQKMSEAVIVQHGVEGSKKIFLDIKPGEYKSLPEGRVDNTHFSEYGARIMAGLFCDGLREMDHELVKYLKK